MIVGGRVVDAMAARQEEAIDYVKAHIESQRIFQERDRRREREMSYGRVIMTWKTRMLRAHIAEAEAEVAAFRIDKESLEVEKATLENQCAYFLERDAKREDELIRLNEIVEQGKMREAEREGWEKERDDVRSQADIFRLRAEASEAEVAANKLLYDGELSSLFGKLEDAMRRQDGEVSELKTELLCERRLREEMVEEVTAPIEKKAQEDGLLKIKLEETLEREAQLRAELLAEIGEWRERAEVAEVLMWMGPGLSPPNCTHAGAKDAAFRRRRARQGEGAPASQQPRRPPGCF